MAKPKYTGLGKGLDAVFFENETTTNGSVTTMRISEIEPNPNQPRTEFDEKALGELAVSIREHGLIQPIVVRPSKAEGYYTIIAGERRWRASKLAGLEEIPVVVREIDDKTAAQLAIIENVQREDLNPVEEARAYKELISEYGMTQDELASKIGKSRPAITNALRTLDLPADVLEMLANGKITSGHARALLGLKDKSSITSTAVEIMLKNMSVRDAEKLVKRLNKEGAAVSNARKNDAKETLEPDYIAILSDKMTKKLGKRVEIGRTGEKGKLHISFNSNEELDELVTLLCGNNIFDEN